MLAHVAKRLFAGLLAAAMVTGSAPGGMTVYADVAYQESGIYTAAAGTFNAACVVTVGGDAGTPAPWGAPPSPNQYRYQKEELAAFCHFGSNTLR